MVKHWIVDTENETLTVGEASVLGLPEDDRDAQQELEGAGRYRVTITYKGMTSDSQAEKESWNGRLSFREEKLETHPFIDLILERYEGKIEGAGDEKKIVFPEFLSEKSQGRGLDGSSKKTQQRNPMFSATTYPQQIGEVEHEYYRTSLPSDIYTRSGRVVQALPGRSDIETPEGYVWLMQPPEFSNEGDGWRIRDRYQLVPSHNYLVILSSIIVR